LKYYKHLCIKNHYW